MIQFLKRLFGYGCCTEFTQWETKERSFSRIPISTQDILAATSTEDYRIHFTKRWQERRCIICGKVQQKELKW